MPPKADTFADILARIDLLALELSSDREARDKKFSDLESSIQEQAQNTQADIQAVREETTKIQQDTASFTQWKASIEARFHNLEATSPNSQSSPPADPSISRSVRRRLNSHATASPSHPSSFPSPRASSPPLFSQPSSQQEQGANPLKVKVSGFGFTAPRAAHTKVFQFLKDKLIIPTHLADSVRLQSRGPGKGFGLLFSTADQARTFLSSVRDKDLAYTGDSFQIKKLYFSPDLPPRIAFQRYCLARMTRQIRDHVADSPPWDKGYTLFHDKFSGRIYLENTSSDSTECHDLLNLRVSSNPSGKKDLSLRRYSEWQKLVPSLSPIDSLVNSVLDELTDDLQEQRW